MLNIAYESLEEDCRVKCAHESINSGKLNILQRFSSKISLPMPLNQLIDQMLTWVDRQLEDYRVFPRKQEQSFPEEFITEVASPMFELYLFVLEHIYEKHSLEIRQLDLMPYINALSLHIIAFVQEHGLIPAHLIAAFLIKVSTGCNSSNKIK